LFTTLPVIDLSVGAVPGVQVIPHFAVGSGMTTQIVLVNSTGNAMNGTLQFLDPLGGSAVVRIDSYLRSSLSYSVAPNSYQKIVVTGGQLATQTGSVRVAPTDGGPAPVPFVILGAKNGDVTVSESAIPVTMGTAFRMYAQLSSAQRIRTGVAI